MTKQLIARPSQFILSLSLLLLGMSALALTPGELNGFFKMPGLDFAQFDCANLLGVKVESSKTVRGSSPVSVGAERILRLSVERGLNGPVEKFCSPFKENCFNAVLAWDDDSLLPRVMDPLEFGAHLRQRYFPLARDADLQSEDLAVIEDEGFPSSQPERYVHAFRIVGVEGSRLVIWHKSSRFRRDPRTFEYFEDTLDSYGLDDRLVLTIYRKRPA